MRYTDLGTQSLRGRARDELLASLAAQGYLSGVREQPPIGYTAPTLIFDQMRSIDASATSLDGQMATIADTNVRDSWRAWLANWRQFFAKRGPSWWGTNVVTQFESDKVLAETQDFARQLGPGVGSWYEIYSRQHTVTGAPVAPPISPGAPAPLPQYAPPDAPSPGILSLVPWWGWAGFVVVGGAIGYGFWVAAKNNPAALAMRGALSLATSHDASQGGLDVPLRVLSDVPPVV